MQWGNHDIVWMGAAGGSEACIANVIRNSLKYNNFDVLEDGYGISIRPLMTFTIENEKDMYSESVILEHTMMRRKVSDTDNGQLIKAKIKELERLLAAYRKGILTEHSSNFTVK